jgi:hypothetical protein
MAADKAMESFIVSEFVDQRAISTRAPLTGNVGADAEDRTASFGSSP